MNKFLNISLIGLLVFQIFILFHFSYADEIEWAISFGGVENEHIDHILVCSNNDVIILGTFSDSISFGNGLQNKDTIVCENDFEDVFIAKFNSDGEFLWVTSIAHGPENFDWWIFPSVDQNDNLLICGTFINEIIIGKDQPNEISLNSPKTNSLDIFLTKILSDGQVDWAIQAGDEQQEQVWDTATDIEGSIYTTGRFWGDSTCFPGGMNDDIILYGNENAYSLFIVKYDKNGDLHWANSIRSDYDLISYSIAVSKSGKVMIGGYYTDNMVLETETIVDTILFVNGGSDIFIAIYDSSGNYLRAISEGGINYDVVQDLTFDSNENIIVTGSFQGTVIMGSTDTLISDNSIFDDFDDIFLAKYDSEGNYLWSLQEGGGMLDGGERLQIFESDKILLSGYYWVEATFSHGKINETTISNIADTSSHFAAKYSPAGNLLWVADVDSSFFTFNTNIAINLNGDMLRAGEYYGNINLMSEKNSIPLNSTGGADIYLAKFSDDLNSINEERILINSFALNQNYPNPFNPTTTIEYIIPKREKVKIELFNILGERIDILVDEIQLAGKYKLNLNLHCLPSGIYFYKLTAGSFKKTNKMILLR